MKKLLNSFLARLQGIPTSQPVPPTGSPFGTPVPNSQVSQETSTETSQCAPLCQILKPQTSSGTISLMEAEEIWIRWRALPLPVREIIANTMFCYSTGLLQSEDGVSYKEIRELFYNKLNRELSHAEQDSLDLASSNTPDRYGNFHD